MNSSSTEKTSPNLGADFEEVGKILERNDSQLDQDNRNRKISGFSINEYISRNGWKVEKLPTFEHLQISATPRYFYTFIHNYKKLRRCAPQLIPEVVSKDTANNSPHELGRTTVHAIICQ